jgi:hypothetical protein
VHGACGQSPPAPPGARGGGAGRRSRRNAPNQPPSPMPSQGRKTAETLTQQAQKCAPAASSGKCGKPAVLRRFGRFFRRRRPSGPVKGLFRPLPVKMGPVRGPDRRRRRLGHLPSQSPPDMLSVSCLTWTLWYPGQPIRGPGSNNLVFAAHWAPICLSWTDAQKCAALPSSYKFLRGRRKRRQGLTELVLARHQLRKAIRLSHTRIQACHVRSRHLRYTRLNIRS